jgi:chromosome partitioning protein
MILTVGGIKGGSGKTTIATTLAIIRASLQKDVLLVDADDQETASDFTILRNEKTQEMSRYTSVKLTGSSVRTEILRMVDKYDDIIIDTGGRDTTSQRAALTISQKLIVPFVPRSFDIWTLEKVSELVTEISLVNPNLEANAFINRGDPKGQENKETAELLKESISIKFIDIIIGTRKAFGNAASQGLCVTEIKPADEKAIEEVLSLYKHIFDF